MKIITRQVLSSNVIDLSGGNCNFWYKHQVIKCNKKNAIPKLNNEPIH